MIIYLRRRESWARSWKSRDNYYRTSLFTPRVFWLAFKARVNSRPKSGEWLYYAWFSCCLEIERRDCLVGLKAEAKDQRRTTLFRSLLWEAFFKFMFPLWGDNHDSSSARKAATTEQKQPSKEWCELRILGDASEADFGASITTLSIIVYYYLTLAQTPQFYLDRKLSISRTTWSGDEWTQRTGLICSNNVNKYHNKTGGWEDTESERQRGASRALSRIQ